MQIQAHDHPKAMLDRLAADGYQGRVVVRLGGSGEVTGTIGERGDHAVIIRALAGRDFFDAWVRYDAIVCIEVQARS